MLLGVVGHEIVSLTHFMAISIILLIDICIAQICVASLVRISECYRKVRTFFRSNRGEETLARSAKGGYTVLWDRGV